MWNSISFRCTVSVFTGAVFLYMYYNNNDDDDDNDDNDNSSNGPNDFHE